MKRIHLAALLCTTLGLCGGPALAQQITLSSPPFSRMDGYLKMPDGRHMGSISAIAGDSHGNIWIAERCGANDCAGSPLDPVLEFDPSGNFIKKFGAGQLLFPHFLYIDKQDHLWIVDNHDNGKIGDDVIEYDQNGHVLKTLGTPGVAGDDQTHFREPSSVLVAPDGDIFVGDGHSQGKGNARIVKFDRNGKFLAQWGGHGFGPGQMEIPHCLAMDSQGRLFVGDRGNNRMDIFDQNGKFIASWSQFGRPSGCYIDSKDNLHVQWTREDDFMHDFYRPAGYHQFKGAIDKQGRLDGWQEHFITFTADGKKPVSGGDYSGFLKYSTKAPNLRRGVTMMDLMIPTGPWRAPGDNAQVFAQQSFMHELSLASGRDHVQFLIDAVNRDVPELAPKSPKVNFSPARATGVIKLCAEKAGWGKKLPKGSGLGLAWCYSHAGHVAQAVELSVDAKKRVKIHRVVVVADIGPIVDMAGAEAQAQGASVDGFSTAMGLQLHIEKGVIQEQNYNAYPMLRIPFTPTIIEAYFIQSDNPPTGMGEPALPAMAPATANAIFAATGERLRAMPFRNFGYTV